MKAVHTAAVLLLMTLITAACETRRSNSNYDQTGNTEAKNQSQIYTMLVEQWLEEAQQPTVNVSNSAIAPTADKLKEFSSCVADDKSFAPSWVPAADINDIGTKIKNNHVKFVDPRSWKPTDPEELIARGQPIESAVEQGFANGLLTISAITFNENRTTAALTSSFVCGGLCGHGETLIFDKLPSGWVRRKTQCGGWIS